MNTWRWIKKEILFAEELTDKELAILMLQCLAAVPVVIIFTWLMFGAGYALQGSWPW
jgi:hypothetical protein